MSSRYTKHSTSAGTPVYPNGILSNSKWTTAVLKLVLSLFLSSYPLVKSRVELYLHIPNWSNISTILGMGKTCLGVTLFCFRKSIARRQFFTAFADFFGTNSKGEFHGDKLCEIIPPLSSLYTCSLIFSRWIWGNRFFFRIIGICPGLVEIVWFTIPVFLWFQARSGSYRAQTFPIYSSFMDIMST